MKNEVKTTMTREGYVHMMHLQSPNNRQADGGMGIH